MYYTIGKDAINHWLAVYRANTKYVGRLAPAEFEDLVNKLGIEQIESVVQKQKHERERIGAREMEASDDDIDNDEDELAHVSGYRTMEAKPLPTAEAKSLKTYKLNFRY